MTVIQALQDATALVNVKKVDTVSSVDDTSKKFIALANVVGDEIASRADWSAMLGVYNATLGTLPTDFLRLVAGGALNLTAPTLAPVRGPLSSDQLASIARLGTTTALYYSFANGAISYSRVLLGSEVIELRYISRNWLLNGSTPTNRIIADSDTTRFPERLLTKGIVWRFKRDTGLPYEDELAEWEADIALEIRQNRGVTT
jgi:hypothetical protein